MRKCWIILAFCMILAGCASETFETLGPVEHENGAAPVMGSIQLQLPEDAAAESFGGEDVLYQCGDYNLWMQTLRSGDFQNTVYQLSGFFPEKLTVVESQVGENKRYDWVWTAASEDGDMLCRAAVLDDGAYHYCLCVMASAGDAGKLTEQWNSLFASFCLG